MNFLFFKLETGTTVRFDTNSETKKHLDNTTIERVRLAGRKDDMNYLHRLGNKHEE